MILLLLALLLTACGAESDAGQPVPSAEQPAAVVSTVAATPEASTATSPAAPPTATPTVTPPAPLAALVNGQYVFLSEYEQRVAQYEQALLEQAVDLATDEGQATLAQARQDVLQGLIDDLLIEQEASALGVTVTDEELKNQVETDIAGGGGQSAFDEWLQGTGQTRQDYEALLRPAMLLERVMDRVTSDVGTEAEQVHARHIMVDSEEAALQIVAALQQGADFADLVREQSLDAATRDNDGDLGWFPRGLVAPELENAVFSLQPGQISGVVHLGGGYHIFQVVERDAAHPLSPEVQLELKWAVFEEWLAELRAAAVIERYVTE